jgi:hypothetical protein
MQKPREIKICGKKLSEEQNKIEGESGIENCILELLNEL